MLDKIKTLLGITGTDRDDLLNLIKSIITERLAIRLGQTVPEALEYIVIETSVVRYNQLASEGYDSHTVEGESIVIKDDIFAEYVDDIEAWLAAQDEPKTGRGRIRFL